ncbi:oligosaccharide flippase family protein [Streptomyces sp. NPDC050658]|uniref:oligosaccharide flippase family protein n=1 Tax=unclassified Streptomyces TaxID=2593676 RepID=UPI00344AA489
MPAASASTSRNLLWNYGGSAAAFLVQLGYTALTARLVAPGQFGAYALALTLTTLLSYFAGNGMAVCLLRADTLTRSLLRTALRVAVGSGLVCCATVQLAAALVGGLFGIADTVPLLRLLVLQFPLTAVAVTLCAALRRLGRAQSAVLAETGGQLAGSTAGAALLLAGWSPYGLAMAWPVNGAVCLLIAHRMLSGGGPLPDGPAVGVRQLLGLSSFFGSTSFVSSAVSQLPVGCAALLGPAVVGYFSRAQNFVVLPLTVLNQGLARAVAPRLADSGRPDEHHPGRRLLPHRDVDDVVCAASALALGVFGVTAGLGPTALGLLLGPGWEPAVALVPWLSTAAGLCLICYSGLALDQIRHAPRAIVAAQAAMVTASLPVLAVAAARESVTWCALAMAAGPAAGHAVQVACWRRDRVLRVRALLWAHTVHAGIGAGLFLVSWYATRGERSVSALGLGLLALGPCAGALWLGRRGVPAFRVAERRGYAGGGGRRSDQKAPQPR